MLNLAFDYAVGLDIIQDNPARRAKLPRVKKPLKTGKRLKKNILKKMKLNHY